MAAPRVVLALLLCCVVLTTADTPAPFLERLVSPLLPGHWNSRQLSTRLALPPRATFLTAHDNLWVLGGENIIGQSVDTTVLLSWRDLVADTNENVGVRAGPTLPAPMSAATGSFAVYVPYIDRIVLASAATSSASKSSAVYVSSPLATALRDPALEVTFALHSHMPTPRAGATAMAVNGTTLMLIGGPDGARVDALDFTTNETYSFTTYSPASMTMASVEAVGNSLAPSYCLSDGKSYQCATLRAPRPTGPGDVNGKVAPNAGYGHVLDIGIGFPVISRTTATPNAQVPCVVAPFGSTDCKWTGLSGEAVAAMAGGFGYVVWVVGSFVWTCRPAVYSFPTLAYAALQPRDHSSFTPVNALALNNYVVVPGQTVRVTSLPVPYPVSVMSTDACRPLAFPMGLGPFESTSRSVQALGACHLLKASREAPTLGPHPDLSCNVSVDIYVPGGTVDSPPVPQSKDGARLCVRPRRCDTGRTFSYNADQCHHLGLCYLGDACYPFLNSTANAAQGFWTEPFLFEVLPWRRTQSATVTLTVSDTMTETAASATQSETDPLSASATPCMSPTKTPPPTPTATGTGTLVHTDTQQPTPTAPPTTTANVSSTVTLPGTRTPTATRTAPPSRTVTPTESRAVTQTLTTVNVTHHHSGGHPSKLPIAEVLLIALGAAIVVGVVAVAVFQRRAIAGVLRRCGRQRGSQSNPTEADLLIPSESQVEDDGAVASIEQRQYRIRSVIGRGGFGAVYHAVRCDDGVDVALKYIPYVTDADARAAMEEARALLLLQQCRYIMPVHAVIANTAQLMTQVETKQEAKQLRRDRLHADRTQDLFQDEACIILISPFYPGGDLRHFVNSTIRGRGCFPEETAARIGAQIVAGVKFAHDMRVAHRDIKPENVLLSADHRGVVLSDFGLSKVMETKSETLRTKAGSLPFVAPECFRGRYECNVDNWSIGCLLYAIATGRVDADTTRMMFSEVRKPSFTTDLWNDMRAAGYHQPYAEVVLGLLKFEPTRRMDLAEAQRRLQAIAGEEADLCDECEHNRSATRHAPGPDDGAPFAEEPAVIDTRGSHPISARGTLQP